MNLIIVESPTKAKKIQTFLGNKYIVKSSQGHIVELDTKNLETMIKKNFTPIYKLQSSKKKLINNLKSTKAINIILAADDDREGEAIAWHCGNLLKVDFKKSNRILFNEITKKAIEKSLKNPKKINLHSVNAQRCRQLVDLIIGFKLSPLLWKHIDTNIRGLSAGRVQSCLLYMLINHDTKIKDFKSVNSYKITADFSIEKDILNCVYESKKKIDSEKWIQEFFESILLNKKFIIYKIINKKEKKYPPHPLITSSLQQIAQKEAGFSVNQTMSIAQKLFENGKITYMRTDSTFISDDFKLTIKNKIISDFGNEYYNNFTSKKGAHEAIRPTDINYVLSDKFSECDIRIYNLIKKITIISHMKPAEYETYIYYLKNKSIQGEFSGSQKFLQFPGFLNYSKNNDIEKIHTFNKDTECILIKALGRIIKTNPPQYWNESSIVKHLETSGVGRPSTYASIINTLYTRNYTEIVTIDEIKNKVNAIELKDNSIHKIEDIQIIPKQSKRVNVTDLGHTVMKYLITHFSFMINVDFTSQVERDLDEISNGKLVWTDIIKKIYNSFISIVDEQMKFKKINHRTTTFENYIVKKGQYGEYLQDTNTNENYRDRLIPLAKISSLE